MMCSQLVDMLHSIDNTKNIHLQFVRIDFEDFVYK